jgi:hypothetical protein
MAGRVCGRFRDVEYLGQGTNQSVPGTLGWAFEEILLNSPAVRLHRNKLARRWEEIRRALRRNRSARVLSIACGGWGRIRPGHYRFPEA